MLGKHHLLDARLEDTGEFRVKIASVNEIEAFIAGFKPDPAFAYLHVIAMGAGEYYGCNKNADYFPERSLIMYHHTFEQQAKVYRNHDNRKDSPYYGHVAKSWYNPTMHRVELILAVDKAKAPDIIDRLEKGEHPEVSMGCRVPHDVCSICGNKAAKKNEYCHHITHDRRKVYPDGKQAYMLNLQPTFFDISFVFRRADKIAFTLRKVAGVEEECTLDHVEDVIEKEASEKEVPAEAVVRIMNASMMQKLPQMESIEPDLPVALLDRLALRHTIGDILHSCIASMFPLKPREFARIVVINQGLPIHHAADIERQLYYPHHEADFEGAIDPAIIAALTPHFSDRSSYIDYVVPRLVKAASLTYMPEADAVPVYGSYSTIPAMYSPEEYAARNHSSLRQTMTPLQTALLMASLYAGYRGIVGLGKIRNLVTKNTLPIALTGGGILAANALLDPNEKQASAASFLKYKVGLPFVGAHFAAAHYRKRYAEGQELSPTERFIAEYPDVISMAAPFVIHGAHRMVKKAAREKIADVYDTLGMILTPGILMKGKGYQQGVNMFDQALDVAIQSKLMHNALDAASSPKK
jgi:hypothetical protein